MAPAPTADPRGVDDYLSNVPPAFRSLLGDLRRTVRSVAPHSEELLSYGMPAFRQNGILLYYGAFRDHCSLFVASTTVRRTFAADLKPFAGGKGTVQFTPDRPLPAHLVRRIVRARIAENLARGSR